MFETNSLVVILGIRKIRNRALRYPPYFFLTKNDFVIPSVHLVFECNRRDYNNRETYAGRRWTDRSN